MIITPVFPVADEDLVSVTTEIVCDVEDLLVGVDLTTLVVTVAGVSAYTGGSFQAGFTGSILADPKHTAGRRYRVIVKRTAAFTPAVKVAVTVAVSSLTSAPANLSWSFRPFVQQVSLLNTAADVIVVNPGISNIRWIVYVQDSTVYARKDTNGSLSPEQSIAPGYLVDAGYNASTGQIFILFEHNGLVFETHANFLADTPSQLAFVAEQLFTYYRLGLGGELFGSINNPVEAHGGRSVGQGTEIDVWPEPSSVQVLEDGASMTISTVIPAPAAGLPNWQAVEFFTSAPGGVTKLGEVPYVAGVTEYSLTRQYAGSIPLGLRHGVAIRYTSEYASYIVATTTQLGRSEAYVMGLGGDLLLTDTGTAASSKVSFLPIQFTVIDAQTYNLGLGGDLTWTDTDTAAAAKVSFLPIQFTVIDAQTYNLGLGGDASRMNTVDKEGFVVVST